MSTLINLRRALNPISAFNAKLR